MNELKLMAIKAKSRLLNKGLREIYSNVNTSNQKEDKMNYDIKPTIEIANENERKRQILNMIKNRV